MNSWYKYVSTGVTSVVGRQLLKTQKNSPTILFVGGVIGVVATTVMASRATMRLDDTLKETREKSGQAKALVERNEPDLYSQEDYRKDLTILYSKTAVSVTKLYGPTIIVGVVSIAALTKSHRILTSRNAALTAAYAALEKGFAEYRRRVVQEYGEDIDRKLRFSKDLELPRQKDGEEKNVAQLRGPNDYSVYARFFDNTTRHFRHDAEYNLFYIRSQQFYANDLLRARGHIFLNEVYDMLGLDRSKAGQVVGWVISKDGDNYVDFGIFERHHEGTRAFVNGHEPVVLLDFNVDGVIYDKI